MFRHMSTYGWWFDATWPSQGLPCGTFILVVVIKIFWSPWGSTPGPPHHVKTSQHPPDHYTAACFLLYICVLIYFNCICCIYGRGRAGA
jgi:hypothetical protein